MDGSVDWLDTIPNPEKIDYGYSDFYASVDTTIQGHNTYKQIISWGIPFPYADKRNFVFTTNSTLKNTEHVDFISQEHINFVKTLKEKEGKHIWIIGGGQLNRCLLNENLIDEIWVFVMPIILESGIDLFQGLPKKTHLTLITSQIYASGVMALKYKVN